MDQSLTVRIKGDASGATSSGSELIDILNSISASVAKMAEASVAGHGVAKKSAEEHAEAEGILGATIGKVETATNSAARAFGALGLQTGEASERVLALTEALEGVQAAALPLVALGAVVLGFGAAFNFVKESIGDAAKMQSEVQALGIAVQDQGGKWNEARDGVEKWAESLENATTFSKSEAISALDQLVTAGVRLSDAQKIVAISTDVAAGSHRSLGEVVSALKEAEAGRGMGLVQLDENLKTVIKSHGHLSDVLTILSRDFSGQATDATNTYEGKQHVLHNTLESLSETIGSDLIPTLTEFATIMIGVAKGVEENWDNITLAASRYFRAISDIQTLTSQISGPMDKVRAGYDIAHLFDRSYHPPKNQFQQFFDDLVEKAKVSGEKSKEEWLKHFRDNAAKNLINDSNVGTQNGIGGLSAPPDIQSDQIGQKDETLSASQEKLKKQLADLTDGELLYRQSVELATTANEKSNAEMVLHEKIAADAKIAVADITAANVQLSNSLTKLTPEQTQQSAAYESARGAYNAYVASLQGGEPTSKEQEHQLHALKTAMDAAWKSYDNTRQAVSRLSAELDENNKKLEEQRAHLLDVAAAQAQIDQKYNESTIGNSEKNLNDRNTHGKSLEDQKAYWNQLLESLHEADLGYAEYSQRLAEYGNNVRDLDTKIAERDADTQKQHALAVQQLQDAEATYNMSLQQQIRYYEQRYAQQITADGEYSDESKKLWDEIIKLDGESFKQLSDAHKQLISEITKEETSFLDQVITKHKSFRDDLKTIWSDIEKNWEQSVEKMILDPNNGPLKDINQGIFNALSPSGGGGRGPTGAEGSPFYVRIDGASGKGAVDVTSDASQYGLLGIHLGASAASAAISALPSNSGLLGFLAGNTYATSGGADMANASFGDWGSSGSRAQSLFGTAAKDFGIGQVATSALEPNANPTDSSIGDLLGTGAALLSKANPLAGAALAIGGSLLGGLIGPHETAQQTPDISQSGYQQIIANLTGQTQDSNGNLTFANSQYDTTIGNQSQSQDLSSWLNDPSNVASLPAGAQQAYKDLIADQGTDTNDGIDPIASSIHQGMITLASGQTVSVDQYESDINTIQQLAGDTSTTPVFSLSRTYPTFSSTLGTQIGTAYNDPNQSQAVANGQGVAPAAGGSLRTTQSATTPLISISFDGANLVGSIPNDVVNQLATKLQDAFSGLVPGAYSPTQSMVRVGN